MPVVLPWIHGFIFNSAMNLVYFIANIFNVEQNITSIRTLLKIVTLNAVLAKFWVLAQSI